MPREASCTFSRRPHRRLVRAITLSTSPISPLGARRFRVTEVVKLLWGRGALSKLRAADDERRQAKRKSLADKLTVEAKALADLNIEKASVEGERRTVDADLEAVRYLATLLGAGDQDVLRWFTLVMALLLDPAAVLLLLVSARRED
jgi:hypothetical protein